MIVPIFQPDKGMLFEIPITVVKPEGLDSTERKQSVSYKEVCFKQLQLDGFKTLPAIYHIHNVF
jgi:hypothetical protein